MEVTKVLNFLSLYSFKIKNTDKQKVKVHIYLKAKWHTTAPLT